MADSFEREARVPPRADWAGRDRSKGADWEGSQQRPRRRTIVVLVALVAVAAGLSVTVPAMTGGAPGGVPELVERSDPPNSDAPTPGIALEPDRETGSGQSDRPEVPPAPSLWDPADRTEVLPGATGTLYTLRGGAIVGVTLGTGELARMPVPGAHPDSLVATDDGAVAVSSGTAWGWSAHGGGQPFELGPAERVLPGEGGAWLVNGDELRHTQVNGAVGDVRTVDAHEDVVAVTATHTVVERRAGYQGLGREDPGLERPLRSGAGPSQTRRVSSDRFGAGRRLHTTPRHVVWASCETNRTCTLGVDELDGAGRRRLPLPIEGASVSEVWARSAADAGRVAVITAEASREGAPRTVLAVLDVESGATWSHPLAPVPAVPPTLAWGSDGDQLAYRTASGDVALWRLADDAVAILSLPTGPAAAIALH